MKRRKFRGGLGLLLCGLLAAVAVLLTDAAAATPESPSTAGGQLVRFDLRRCLDELPADDVLQYD
ncbi:MAG TPA: hypothetical protein PLO53_07520, partial [Candidatus Hydrogenedentes bacterium]|nr:hypothetical protein [Candidatus Hydrogenedentota bacterium]